MSKPTNLEMFRKMKNMTQYELSFRVDSHQPIISLLENPDGTPLTETQEVVLERCKEILDFPGRVKDLLKPFKMVTK